MEPTTEVGLISDDEETAYRLEVEHHLWGQQPGAWHLNNKGDDYRRQENK